MPTPARREISAIDTSASRVGEGSAGGGEDLVAVALGVGASRGGRHRLEVDRLSATVKRTTYPLQLRSSQMDHRPLGRSGVSVSQLCLGAMMFGAFGNPDHDDSIRIIHRALDAGINVVDTADFYSAGESEEIVGKALRAGARTWCWPPRSACPSARTPTSADVAALDHAGGGGLAATAAEPTGSTSTRCTASIPPSTSTRRSAPCPTSSTRQDPRLRRLDRRRLGDRRGPVGRRAPRPRALPHRAASLLDPDPRDRVRRAARPACATGWAC